VAQSDFFTVCAGRVASWILRYRYGGRCHELTLGRYPELSLARTAAAKAHIQVAEGVDVALAP
jgi:hypothetical protein